MDPKPEVLSVPQPPRRKRLTPDTRIPLILDAALTEFSNQGYSATRVDDIATRAGLSKSGFYAHFSGKDQVFEALLKHSLQTPSIDLEALLEGDPDLPTLVDRLVAAIHAPLDDPKVRATTRLMLSEGHRLPDIVRQWRQNVLGQVNDRISTLLRICIDRGLCRDGPLRQYPWLVSSPMVHTLIQQLSFNSFSAAEMNQARQAHKAMLMELLALK
ncbi:TetR/AcrR family transcriptional regulator [Zoogloea sp.]|uniref:TetR/AcrR family transcriptional regulator n=1 Tax=Zoogloea sp. TaxID=49181 RepID=UPI002625E980|nr:TetR/AcrR family transcriptional regulator [Zoogloea sp.]MDD3352833.1 TetR/AcrR family transcriptional regulator [Zoogloea sp.]